MDEMQETRRDERTVWLRSQLLGLPESADGGENPPTETGEKLGRYPVTGQLGEGGMGTILSVQDPEIGRTVAAKVIRGEAGQDMIAKFVQEAQVTGQLEHPNIVPVYELGISTAEQVYFTMKRIVGEDLAHLLKSGNAGSLAELLQVFLKVCDAIAFAHSKGVIHRDLKPANIMVGAFGEVLVMDWGLAKLVDREDIVTDSSSISDSSPERTIDGAVMGTLPYMPPEQAQGKVHKLDERADIYSLGAILYEILTLKRPYEGKSTWAVINEIGQGKLVPPSERAPDRNVPWELETVVLKAMAKRRTARYQDVAELKRDIERFIEGGRLAAASYNPLQLLGKSLRHHRTLVLSGAAVLLVGLLLFGYFRWQTREATLQREQKAREAHEAKVRAAMAAVDKHEGLAGQKTLRAALEQRSKDTVLDPAGDRWQATLAGYLAKVSALDHALDLEPDDEELRQKRRGAGEALGLTAVLSGDYNLARQAMEDLRHLGVPGSRVEALLAMVERERHRIRDERRVRLTEILEDIRAGLSRPDRPKTWRLEEYVLQAATFRDRQTVDILARALEPMTRLAVRQGREVKWTNEQRDVAIFVCRVLGQLGRPEVIEPLARWMRAVWSKRLAVEAGLALCNTRSAAAYGPLIDARKRLGINSEAWVQIKPGMMRIELPDLSATSSLDELHQRAIARRETGDFQGALADFTRILERNPRKPDVLGNRGSLRAEMGDLKGALADLTAAIRMAPRWAVVYYNRARVYREMRLNADARRDFDQAIDLDSGFAAAFAERAMLKRDEGDLEAALADADRAVQLTPTNAGALNARGCIRADMNDQDGAMEDFQAAIRAHPRVALAYMNRAHMLDKQGHRVKAMADYDKAVELEPMNATLYLARGKARSRAGDTAGALVDYEKVIELKPNRFPLAYNNRGNIHNKKGDWDKAIRDYTRAIELDPKLFLARMNRAIGRQITGDLKGSVADFEVASKLEPREPNLWFYYGVTLARNGDTRAGLAALEKERTIQPRNPYIPIWIWALGGPNPGLERVTRRTDWAGRIARCLLGRITAGALLRDAAAAVKADIRRDRTVEARCYLGLLAERRGDTAAAKSHYKACKALKVLTMIEHGWASTRLSALSQ